MKNWKTRPVATPTFVVVTPTIVPASPAKVIPALILSIRGVGGSIRTTGGVVDAYPVLAVPRLTAVTTPLVIVAVAVCL